MTDAVPAADSAPARRRSETRQAVHATSIRLTPPQHAGLKAAAAERGCGVSTLIRAVALSLVDGAPALPRRRRQPVADPATLQRLLAELGKTGSNINQVAHRLNAAARAGKTVAPRLELLEQQLEELRAMRTTLCEALR